MIINQTTAQIELKCSECGVKFFRQPSKVRSKDDYFCGQNCYFAYQRKHPHTQKGKTAKPRIVKSCPNCKVDFKTQTRRSQTHCSKKCEIENSKIVKFCRNCNEKFICNKSQNQKKFCSAKCYRSTIKPKLTCKRCGKKFRNTKEGRAYCSETCRRPPCLINCVECRKDFRVCPCEIKTRRFCSTRCYRKFTGETEPEKNVRIILEENRINFHQEFKVKGWRYPVDFYLPDYNLMLEVDEPYWHNKTKERDERKTEFLQSKGFTVLRLDATPFYNKTVSKNKKFLIHSINSVN